MKKNLIIFLFTLLLGGITCFNYSYASTVSVPESVCKKIQENYESFYDNWLSQWVTSYNENEIPENIKNQVKGMSEEDKQNVYAARWWANHASSLDNNASTYAQQNLQSTCESKGCLYFHEKCVACPWIRLNTNIPFIWNCIPTSTQTEVFPVFIGGLIQFTMSLLVLIWFICIIVGGVKISLWDTWWWRDLIMKVVYAMAALWASWVILKIINPNFFS